MLCYCLNEELRVQRLTEEAGLAQVHVRALQTAVAVSGSDSLTSVTRDLHVQQITVPRNEHVHLQRAKDTSTNSGFY